MALPDSVKRAVSTPWRARASRRTCSSRTWWITLSPRSAPRRSPRPAHGATGTPIDADLADRDLLRRASAGRRLPRWIRVDDRDAQARRAHDPELGRDCHALRPEGVLELERDRHSAVERDRHVPRPMVAVEEGLILLPAGPDLDLGDGRRGERHLDPRAVELARLALPGRHWRPVVKELRAAVRRQLAGCLRGGDRDADRRAGWDRGRGRRGLRRVRCDLARGGRFCGGRLRGRRLCRRARLRAGLGVRAFRCCGARRGRARSGSGRAAAETAPEQQEGAAAEQGEEDEGAADHRQARAAGPGGCRGCGRGRCGRARGRGRGGRELPGGRCRAGRDRRGRGGRIGSRAGGGRGSGRGRVRRGWRRRRQALAARDAEAPSGRVHAAAGGTGGPVRGRRGRAARRVDAAP